MPQPPQNFILPDIFVPHLLQKAFVACGVVPAVSRAEESRVDAPHFMQNLSDGRFTVPQLIQPSKPLSGGNPAGSSLVAGGGAYGLSSVAGNMEALTRDCMNWSAAMSGLTLGGSFFFVSSGLVF